MIGFSQSKLMSKYILMLSLLLVLPRCRALVEALAESAGGQTGQGNLTSNEGFKSDEDSILSNPLFIALVVLLAFNLLVFILVYGCRRCLKLPYQVNVSGTREYLGTKYPNVRFQTKSYCLIQQEQFYGRECYESSNMIVSLPAFIYGREIDAQVSHLNYFTIWQCARCEGLTRTIEMFKYGRLRECWETLFMILISPCFLAFTIHRITSNSILWRKFFCTECGFEKTVQK